MEQSFCVQILPLIRRCAIAVTKMIAKNLQSDTTYTGEMMANCHRMARQRANFGTRPKGWKQVAFDIPEGLANDLKNVRDELPSGGSMKLIGTSLVALFLGLPQDVRNAMYRWAHSHELEPSRIDPKQIAMILVPNMLLLLKSNPPTESSGGEVADPNSIKGKKPLCQGEFELRGDEVQREGYTEQQVIYMRRNQEKPDAGAPKSGTHEGRA